VPDRLVLSWRGNVAAPPAWTRGFRPPPPRLDGPGGRLARHIADAGFAEIRRQLGYKTTWNGGRLLVADRWYPSSKTCSGCGTVKTKLALSEREYDCEACGLVLDRDLNAARNLAALAAEYDTAGSGPVAGRGANQKTRLGGQAAVKRQPGTASAGQTGTRRPHGGATG
jgi:Putative transposase DNA-binding domain